MMDGSSRQSDRKQDFAQLRGDLDALPLDPVTAANIASERDPSGRGCMSPLLRPQRDAVSTSAEYRVNPISSFGFQTADHGL
jgi:hypothetical protein